MRSSARPGRAKIRGGRTRRLFSWGCVIHLWPCGADIGKNTKHRIGQLGSLDMFKRLAVPGVQFFARPGPDGSAGRVFMKHKPLIHRSNTVRRHDDPSVVVSVDQYMVEAAEKIVEADLRFLAGSRGRIEEKLALEAVRQHYDLVEGIRMLLAHFEARPAGSRDLGGATREAAAGLLYFLSGADLIPDSTPEIGFTDDARIVACVLDRNPSLRSVPAA